MSQPDASREHFATLPEPPYYAVIFSSQRTAGDEGYEAMAERMLALASQQAGFLGAESVRGTDGFGITVSYWHDEASIAHWRAVAEHQEAQRLGHQRWYERFEIRVARVERTRSKR